VLMTLVIFDICFLIYGAGSKEERRHWGKHPAIYVFECKEIGPCFHADFDMIFISICCKRFDKNALTATKRVHRFLLESE
jgi:hypothetical protein